jgi:multiple sugar transport system ATP-binding protein
MNFATVVRADGAAVMLGERKLELTGSVGRSIAGRPGSNIVMGFRPEHMRLAIEGNASAITIPATVDVVEYLGNDELVHARIGGADGTEIVALSEPHPSLKAGETVEFAVPSEKVYFFDSESEERLIAQP